MGFLWLEMVVLLLNSGWKDIGEFLVVPVYVTPAYLVFGCSIKYWF